jgi:hypothetical protein
MPARGRPVTYSKEVGDKVCARLATGESLRSICRDEDMPPESTVREWVIDDREGFAAQYARSRDIGLDSLADEIVEIADTPQLGVKTKIGEDGKTETTEGDMIEHRRLRVDSRKWYLSKVAPKRYGDRVTQEVTGADGKDLVPAASDNEVARRVALLLAKGLAKEA